ncbi:hypothetical protein F5884DRAFT_163011 [Xylogone sp. PMI_703]|nr:hypothetical protein F5884DRAFT_163011 [Xylogone sp. PMI_703]
MTTRPTFIEFRSQSEGPIGNGLPSPRPLPSPRLHVAGEIAPDLSPLDAFAAQSRLLAQRLEQSTKEGKRISRLPPLTVANSLGQGRSAYYRSASAEPPSDHPNSPSAVGLGLKTEVEAPGFRPKSVHPLVSGEPPPVSGTPSDRFNAYDEEQFRGRQPHSPVAGSSYFGARREQSPTSLEAEHKGVRSENSLPDLQLRSSMHSIRQRAQMSRRVQDGSGATNGYNLRTLAPPRSPFAPKNPSPRSMSAGSSDDDSRGTNVTSIPPRDRNPSSDEAHPTSPVSPSTYSLARSPSISSEFSVGGTRLARPAFNFSRPLSRASAPSVDIPMRQESSDSQPSFVLADDTVQTPVSMHSEEFPDITADNPGAPSYVYSKFSLPRGKILQRNSAIFQVDLPQAQFVWEEPKRDSNAQPIITGAPPSPPLRPSTSASVPGGSSNQVSDLSTGRPSLDPDRSPAGDLATTGSPSISRLSDTEVEHSSSPSVGSESTVKAKPQPSISPSAELSAEEHVKLGVECHERGAVNESTYHLRLAARQNHPTGMLLYALACRHGWGMRPNQREGVQWLRKAADCASLEIADDESLLKDGKTVDIAERKTRQAQFALSIYELGVSHMNGWGIEQDKALALRCFEIAGAWGDGDALAEAGFCYAQGIGCKKDLKKSAKFYRMAESKGISMVGNSWYIYLFLQMVEYFK